MRLRGGSDASVSALALGCVYAGILVTGGVPRREMSCGLFMQALSHVQRPGRIRFVLQKGALVERLRLFPHPAVPIARVGQMEKSQGVHPAVFRRESYFAVVQHDRLFAEQFAQAVEAGFKGMVSGIAIGFRP